MSTDADALFDAIERQVMQEWETVEVSFSRIVIPGRGSHAWQVRFKSESSGTRHVMTSGGGTTLREAFTNAFANAVEKRLAE